MSKFNKKSISFMLFDWGTSPIPTIHTTFIFSVYYVNSIAIKDGTFIWGCILAFAGVLTGLLSPVIGSFTDRNGTRKLFLLLLTILGFISTAILWFAKPGDEYIIFAGLFSCFSILSMELIFVLYNSLLCKVTKKISYGKISGYSWCAGYLGGITALILCLLIFIFPERLPFGLSKEKGGDVRACMIFISIWLILFCVPLFIYVKEPEKNLSKLNLLYYIGEGFSIILKSKNVLRYFLARIFYFDALVTLFAFGGIYAAKVFDFDKIEILYFAILINISAALGAVLGGYFDDKFSPFKTIRISLLGLVFTGLILIFVNDKTSFWVVSFFLGFFVGPLQSSSRVLLSKIVPEDRGAQFFGFAIFSGKITSFLGPLIYGSLVMIFESQKFGMLFVILLFLISFFILGKNEPNNISPSSGFK